MASIDDPFGPDASGARPRPGAGSRTFVGSARPQSSPPQSAPEVDAISSAVRVHLGVGLSPLVRAAIPLLALAARLRETRAAMDASSLRRQTLGEIRRFEEQSHTLGVADEVTKAARYALCAGLDEAVLSTPWGGQSEWAQHSLLVTLHNEAWGGEKFFEVLTRISADPARFIDVLELQYLLLAFGFEGKYARESRGQDKLLKIQQELSRTIREQRGAPEAELSIHWRGREDRRNPLMRYVPVWVVGAAALAVLAITFTWYYSRLASAATPIHAELEKIGFEGFSEPQPPIPVRGPSLKQLLAPEESRGILTVEEDGNQTKITLTSTDLFPSGSATVNPAYRETLEHLTVALNRVPGRVLVVGHTDDQAIKSFRYQDNIELSRDRAANVVALLEQGIDNRGRLVASGRGSSEPRYSPPSTPENRGRNRRVEIIHVRGT